MTESLRAVFVTPRIALLAVFFLAVCATPVAFGAPGLQAIYLVPITIAAWIIRARTVVDDTGFAVRTLFGGRAVTWDQVASVHLTPRAKVRAVLQDGGQLTLPAVQARDLPRISQASGGRVSDPTAIPAE